MASIAIDYTPAYQQSGGIGRLTRELIAALAKREDPHTFHLFVAGALPHKLTKFPDPRFSWQTTRLSPQSLARIWHRAHLPLPVEAFTGRVRLYHATDFTLPPTLPGTRRLLTVHDLSFVRVPETASPRLKAYLDAVVPRSVRRSDHIVADSLATKEDLIELYGVRAEKITTILSGVTPQFAPVTDPERLQAVRTRYQIGEESFIFTIGTVQPRKNYARLIQALAQIRQRHDVILVIAGGKGWLEDPIYRTLDDLRMREHVRFIGFADDEDLPALYSAARCLAFPSLYEGFGLPILEAMACGTPVLTSNVSSMPEAAGDAALLIDPNNVEDITTSLERLLWDEMLRTILQQRGFERVQHFTWARAAGEIAQVYENVLAE